MTERLPFGKWVLGRDRRLWLDTSRNWICH